jgi:hypothetical protein
MSSPAQPRQTELVEDGEPGSARTGRHLRLVAAFIIFMAVAAALGGAAGVFRSELSGETDEAAHYITALMVRDYLVTGWPQGPIAFGANYYLHYPKVALGHWPPLFYVLQSLWMLPFGDSPDASILLIMAMTAAMATLIFFIVRREFASVWGAAGCGLLFLLLPVVQTYGRMIMADIPVALFVFSATLVWARFMDRPTARHAIYFGLLASAAILTKGNGYALIFVPPFAIALSRRWRLALNPNVWLSVGVIAVLTVPWNLITRDLIVPTMQQEFGARFLLSAASFYLSGLLVSASFVVTLFALAGMAATIAVPLWRGRVDPLWASMFALILGGEIFHSLIPAGFETRYLLPSFAALILFMAAGVHWISSYAARYMRQHHVAVAAAALIAIGFATIFSIPRKRSFGFDEIARDLQSPEFDRARIVCSSGADGEGLLISEIARRDRPRPNRTIARGTQMFAHMGWNGQNYQPVVHNIEEVREVLNAIPADVVVLDRTPMARVHMSYEDLLATALRNSDWRLTGVYPKAVKATTVPNARIEVYRWVGLPRAPGTGLRVEMNPSPKIVLDRDRPN